MAIDRVGKYQILGELGRGAHSTIYHIRRAEDAKEYALKVVPIEEAEHLKFLEQAEHEFHIAKMLNHPNLIKVHTLETEKNWLFKVKKVTLLIEYVKGKPLDAYGKLSISALIPIFLQTAMGLVHMHSKGVLHADLKPNNILLGPGRRVKVIDYGLAWIKGEPKDRIQGTPEYMAPETVQHKLINERTDIFNLGATMYRLVTGKLPPSAMPNAGISVTGKTWKSMLQRVDELAPKTPSDLAKLIHRCIEYKPAERPESMIEVQEELSRLNDLHGEPPSDG